MIMIGQSGKQNVNEKIDSELDSLRVLMVIPYLPDQSNVVTILAKKVLNTLEKKCNVKLIWILQTPSQSFENRFPNIDIKPIQQFDNACDLMDKEKPDVVFTELSFDYSSYPFIIAGRNKKIPVVCYTLYGYDYRNEYPLSRFDIFYSKISRFFSKRADSHSKNKSFGKGKFYLFKYFFYLCTVKSIGTNTLCLILTILESMWINSFGIMNKKFDTRLICEQICLANDTWINPLVKEGFPVDILHVTGSPLFDEYSINSIPQKHHTNFPAKVLLVTSPMNTHGIWSNKRQRDLVENIVIEMKKYNQKIDFAIKIHPTSENIQFYQEILNDLNLNNKIYQNEKLAELLKQFDVVLSFGVVSGSTLEILYSGLPFVMMNMFINMQSYSFIKNKLAIECSSISKLMASIEEAIKNEPSRKYLENYFYTFSKPLDGRASERIGDVIISIVKRTKDLK